MKLDSAPFQHRRRLWLLFGMGTLFLTLFLILIRPVLPASYGGSEVLIAAVGGIWALAFYLHKQHAEDARFLKELMTEFNARYNQLNNDLQSALWREEPFDTQTKLKFIDYFNLCAEEWMFWKLGYIYAPVWIAWENGMKQYGTDSRVKDLWEKERQTDSHYGFEFPTA